MMWVATGLVIRKKRVMAATLPVKGLNPATIIQAISTDTTEVVLQVEEVCRRV
jgi:hypothetical protein